MRQSNSIPGVSLSEYLSFHNLVRQSAELGTLRIIQSCGFYQSDHSGGYGILDTQNSDILAGLCESVSDAVDQCLIIYYEGVTL